MSSGRASNSLKKLSIKRQTHRPTSKVLPKVDMAVESIIPGSESEVQPKHVEKQEQATSSPRPRVAVETAEVGTSIEQSKGATSITSSPTDPAYIPGKEPNTGQLKMFSKPAHRTPNATSSTVGGVERSFFDSDSESDEDEAVLGRASSVRMSKPSIIEYSPKILGQMGQTYTVSQLDSYSNPSLTTPISEAAERADTSFTIEDQQTSGGGPGEALKLLEGMPNEHIPTPTDTTAHLQRTTGDNNNEGSHLNEAHRSGLKMNPVTQNDKISIQRAISAPHLSHALPSNRKVKIRPSDLEFSQTKGRNRLFRESIVTTPYPDLNEEDEKQETRDTKETKATTSPQRSSTVKSARFDFSNDRFPSPNRPEILFLDLGLARHPAAVTTLEINIADKSVYDDEMLFRQIRTAYRSRLLGMTRLPFFLIRGATHATVSSSAEYTFRTTEFMKHFENPRIGRKRKTWVVWLRHHSLQQSPIRGDHLGIVKRPLSASLRTADKRLSMHSDSTSTVNFSFLPPLSIPRIPFFSKEAISPSLAATYRSPPAVGSEGGIGTVKVELHHEFSFWTLAFLHFWVMLMSITAVVIWTVFGVPGSRPGEGKGGSPVAIMMDKVAWNAGAQNRVLTGVIVGIFVAILGSMLEMCLIAGAYILL